VTTYLSAVFVMVRGCDDIRQGWIARRKAKAATALRSGLRWAVTVTLYLTPFYQKTL
jgi:hypothetical protein